MKTNNISKQIITLLCVFGLFFVVGCATIEGAGEDIESAGEMVQDAADGE